MSPSVEPPYFIVYPENEKLVSGEISFAERKRRKQRKALLWLILAPVVGVAIWVFLSGGSQSQCYTWLFTAFCELWLLKNAISDLYGARLYRQVEGGIFLDGQIVSSELQPKQRGDGYDMSLFVRYRFNAPDGYLLDGNGKAWRYDLWKQAKTEYPQVRSIRNLRDEDRKRLQAFAPPNTPVKIRYVNDSLFTVM